MINYIFKRIVLAFISLFILMTIVYLLVASFSKNPYLASGNLDSAEELAKQNGLYDPILVRYGTYLAGIFSGNFGKIYLNGNGINNIPQLFFLPLRWTLLITIPSFVISLIIGVFLGVLAGYNRGRWLDTAINVFVITFIGLPSFVIAPIMIMIATSSNGAIISEFYTPDQFGWGITIKSAILPIVTISLGSLASYTILVRNQIVSVLTSNHVLIAKSKGLSNWDIFWKHIIRNIMIPLISFVLPSLIILLAGNVVIEQFFNVPGTSTVIVNAFPNGEINIVMFSIIFFALLSMIMQIVLDVSYVFIDPKIKYFESSKKSFIKQFKYFIIRNYSYLKNKKRNDQISNLTSGNNSNTTINSKGGDK